MLENTNSTYEPEPTKVMLYAGPKPTPTRVLVPGKPRNRAYRRAERSFNKKAEAEFNKKTAALVRRTKNDVLGKMAEAKKALESQLQTAPEQASSETPSTSESQP